MTDKLRIIQGFSKKSRDEKLAIIADQLKESEKALEIYKSFHHPDAKTQEMIEEFSENTISNFHLPYSVVPNFMVNNKVYTVPMVIEESSVVAAAAKSAKLWFSRGGFRTEIIDTEKIGQVHFLWNDNKELLIKKFPELKEKLLKDTFDITENMVKRGGGIRSIELKDLSDKEPGLMQIFATFDTVDSMGANFINSCLEQFANTFKKWQIGQKEFRKGGLEIILCILSNLTPNCRVKCYVESPVESLDDVVPGMTGEEFTRRFRLGVRVAEADPFRATTHNKGIFNGVDAVVLATGNDFRAVEACGHAYAARSGVYSPLTKLETDNRTFRFILELPLSLGVVGGLTNLHPLVKLSHELLGHPSATELMGIAAAAGLANNFSAVKSLVTVGIQKGHMKMHLLNILKQLGVPDERKNEVVSYFKDETVSVYAVRHLVESWNLKPAAKAK